MTEAMFVQTSWPAATPTPGGGLKWIHAENRIQPDCTYAQTGYMQGAAGIGMLMLRMDVEEKGVEVQAGFTVWVVRCCIGAIVGQKRTREKGTSTKIEALRAFLFSYQYSLRALIKSLPPEAILKRPPFASIGRYEIWPCRDAAVVLVYPSNDDLVEVVVRESSYKLHNEFMALSEVGTYFQGEKPVDWRPIISVNSASSYILHFADLISVGVLGEIAPKFQKLSIFGWEADLPEPDDEALLELRSELAAQNVASASRIPKQEARGRLDELLANFKDILASANREEEVQRFLADHPELLYPDYILSHPKHRLGEDLVTDYVLLTQGASGQEYVFVEIERPDKPIFVSEGHFSHQFTQAKNQLLAWSTWITENHQYLERRLHGLGRPIFHLVMGRSQGLRSEHRKLLQSEFSGTERKFSTYDDVAGRFERIIGRLFGAE